MSSELHEHESQANTKKRAFVTSALAGGAFGVVISIVFMLMGIVQIHPVLFIGSLTLITSSVSGLSGLAGAALDDKMTAWGIKSVALRSLINFLVISFVTFGTAIALFRNLEWGQAAPHLEQYALPGMFLGLVFGIIVAVLGYRNWKIQQKMHLLELENRYLAEIAQKDQLLQEAARNLAVSQERNNMARELHDSISQGIHGIVYSIHTLRRQLGANSEAQEIIDHLEQTTQATLQELRRMIMELAPSPLEDTSLPEAIQLHCDLFSRRQQADVAVELQYKEKLAPEQEVAVYRIVQEALANIQRHANAKRVTLSLFQDDNKTRLRVKDDGRGFDRETVQLGNGINNMAARARQNNGTFRINSQPGSGTVIEVDITGGFR